MRHTYNKNTQYPSFVSKENSIVEVHPDFIHLSGFPEEELIGKTLKELSRLIRINSQTSLDDFEGQAQFFMFTKGLRLKEITISCERWADNVIIFYFAETARPDLESSLPYGASLVAGNEIAAAVFSCTRKILLDVNQKFVEHLDNLYDSRDHIIGRSMHEIFRRPKNHEMLSALFDVIREGKPVYLKNVKYAHRRRGETFWDVSIIPVSISGELKYFVYTAYDITEKVLGGMFAEKQKNELDQVISNMSDALYVVDQNQHYILLNDEAKKFYKPGLKKIGESANEIAYYDINGEPVGIENYIPTRVLKGEAIKDLRFKAVKPEGTFYYSASGAPVYNEAGEVEKAIFCMRDTTAQVKKDLLIRQQKEQMEAIIENTSDCLFLIEKDGKILSANKTGRENRIFKSTKLENIFEILAQVELYEAEGVRILSESPIIKDMLNGRKLSDYQVLIKENDRTFKTIMNYTPILDSSGDLLMGVLMIKDITEILLNAEAGLLKVQNDLMNGMIENLEVGLIRYSYPDMKILNTNNKSLDFIKKINPELNKETAIDQLSICGKAQLKDILGIIKKKDSSYIFKQDDSYFKLIFQPLYGLNNKIIEIVILVIDIREEIEAKNKLEKTLAAQDEIFANISHELKTPLNLIFSSNQLMEYYVENNLLVENKGKVLKNINIIRQNCYRFTKLINNIVDSTKIDSGFYKLNFINEDIVQNIENIVQSVSEHVREKNLAIVFDTDVEEKYIAFDPLKMERIMLNLISNAIKFTDPGGEISVNISDKGSYIEIYVKDTGIGISNNKQKLIFDRFHQIDKSLSRNAEGSGIGLSIVKSLVDMHGGNISVESEVQMGSTFKIQLPVRTVENHRKQSRQIRNRAEIVKIELSDIYEIAN